MEYFIICPLCFLAGFVDSIAGGGGLISLPAFLFAGLPVHAAIATNKLQATMGTAVATLRYALAGYVALGSAAIGIFCGLLGSSIGARIALATNDFAFRIIMLAILPLVAFYVLRAKDLSKNAEKPLPPSQALPLIATIALVIGIYDGFYGPGTGTFLMLLLT
nr:TSUP family transporter [bacterium]